jgi:hypothetical protein
VGPPAPERLSAEGLAPRSPAGGDGPAPAPRPGPGADPGPGSPLQRFVSVAAAEWSLTLSRPVVGHGSVTVELRNVGEDPHNLILSPDDGSHSPLAAWPETLPGEYQRQTVPLPVGHYLLWCSLEGHEAAGMSVRLRVEQG